MRTWNAKSRIRSRITSAKSSRDIDARELWRVLRTILFPGTIRSLWNVILQHRPNSRAGWRASTKETSRAGAGHGAYGCASPALYGFDDLRHIGCRPFACQRNRIELADRVADDHRNSQRVGFLQTQPNVLVEQSHREPRVECPGKDVFGELVRARRIPRGAGVEHIDDETRI